MGADCAARPPALHGRLESGARGLVEKHLSAIPDIFILIILINPAHFVVKQCQRCLKCYDLLMPNDSYKTFRVSVRPARVVCFIDANDQNWQVSALNIIEAFSRVWGGAYFIIVPTDGQIISDVFWRILLAYDPDYLWVYTARAENSYEPSFELSNDLQQDLKLKLAPFHFKDHIIRGGAYRNLAPRFPYTDLITILPNCERPNSLSEINELQGVMQLWIASFTGHASLEYKEALGSIGIESRTVDYSDGLSELFNLASKGIRGELVVDDTGFPYAFSLTQLGFYRSLKFDDWLEATLVVVGETLQDFCLYYCLARLRGKVMWLLPSWLPPNGIEDYSIWSSDTYLGCFAQSLSKLTKEQGQRGSIYVISLSMSPDDLASVRNLLTQSWHGLSIEEGLPVEENLPSNDQDPAALLSSYLDTLLQFPLRVYERGNESKTVSRHFLGEDMAGFFEPPKPKNFSNIHPYEHRWITEISVIGHHLPRHPLFGDQVVRHGLSSSLEARIGRDGIAFFCPSSSYFGGELDQTLVKPSIHLPDGFSIFPRLMKNVGYDCLISDKGRFTLATLSKFESISSLANFLLTNSKRAVLEKYLNTNKTGPDVKDEGLFLQSDRRRYLDFVAVKKIMGTDKAAANLIDTLIGQSVLHRGLILKCDLCRSTDWFSMAELSHEFRCKRCNRTQTYRQSHTLGRLEPPWYYKLDEIVFKGLANDMLVPLLTLHRLSQKTESFLYSLDVELLDPNSGEQLFELDICCIPDGELTIGAAKRNNRLDRTAREEREVINKYFDLAQKIGATQVVFATYSEQWREETARMITERFSGSLIKVILWGQRDLIQLH